MRKLFISSFLFLFFLGASAQDIQLPSPRKTGGMPLMEALNTRSSSRDFKAGKSLTPQTLSDLLWAAWGYNRENKRTAPSSRDRQEITVYVFLKEGTYRYDARNNKLVRINDRDLRGATGEQDFVATAPLNLVYVADMKKVSGKNREDAIGAIYANTGFIAQNVYLFCASDHLNCVVRAMIDRQKLSRELNLTPDEQITLAQSIGYGK